MASELPEDSRELLQLFAELPAEDRARILSLVRSLSICHAADALRKPPFILPVAKDAPQGSGMVSMSAPVCDPCV
jgi:DNA-binding transcriptional ArsR family regulator